MNNSFTTLHRVVNNGTSWNSSRNISGNVPAGKIENDPLNASFQTLSTAYTLIFLTYVLTHWHWVRVRKSTAVESLRQTSKIILVNSTILLFSPVILIFFALNALLRILLAAIFKTCYGGAVKLMDAQDCAWALDSHAHCNHFTALYVLEGDCDVGKIQTKIRDQLVGLRGARGEVVYEKMQMSVVRKFGFYCWEKKEEFAIENHVKLVEDADARENICGGSSLSFSWSEDQLFEYLRQTADNSMTDETPQWEILLVPRFTYKNNDASASAGDDSKSEADSNGPRHFAAIFKIHHSIMDGVSAGHALKHILADSPIQFAVNPLAPLKIHPVMKWLFYCKTLILGPTIILDAMLRREINCFHKSDLTGPKSFGWSRPVSLSALKKIKDSTKTTTTAVLISSVGGSIRQLAIKKKLEVPTRIQISPTVAMLPYPDITPTNRFVAIHFPLETGLGSSKERLESANETAKHLASSPFALATFMTIKMCAALPAIIVDFLMSCLDATVLLSNVPGPAEPAYLFGGHLMTDSVSWVPLKNWIGIGVCLFSYAGRVRANFSTDKSSMPLPTDLPDLIKGFENELISLAKSAGVPVNQLFLSHLQSSTK